MKINLTEAGKRLSKVSQEKITAAIGVLQELMGAMMDSEATTDATEALRQLQEAEMSHDDVKGVLRAALQALSPGARRWYYVRDVYDDWFVYEDEDPEGVAAKLFKRSYAVVDGTATLGEPQQVYAVTTYQPVGMQTRESGTADPAGNVELVEAVEITEFAALTENAA